MNKQLNIIIAGPTPPPIGGVTIHVQRLVQHLQLNNIPHSHAGRSIRELLTILSKRSKANLIHIHYSNAVVRWLLVILFKLKGLKVLTTIHRDLNRESGWNKKLTFSAVRKSDCTIVLNDKSLKTAKTLGSHCLKLSAFFPPIHTQTLDKTLQEKINSFKEDKSKLFCTNAFDLAFDDLGQEIYQILNLVSIFSTLPDDVALIVSDPSSHNFEHVSAKMNIPNNVLFIIEPHDFIPILEQADCFIRATTTDGDSLSIKEAFSVGTNVIASNCVGRDPLCVLYPVGDEPALQQAILNFAPKAVEEPENAFSELLQIYKNVLYQAKLT